MVQPIWIAMAKESIRLANTVLAEHLRAEQLAIRFAEEDFDRQVLGARDNTRRANWGKR